MQTVLIGTIIVVGLGIYFLLQLVVIPEQYASIPVLEPQPTMKTILSDSEITLGNSFDIEIFAENIGDMADIQIVSVGFPELNKIDDMIKIVSWDFTQTPRYITLGEEIGAEYSSGQKTIFAKYPSIEAYSRPVANGAEYHMTLEISPKNSGNFVIYTKTIALPHLNAQAHYPQDGILDHQGEFVEVYSVEVLP